MNTANGMLWKGPVHLEAATMNRSAGLVAIGCLIQDTFRQALASGVNRFMLIVSGCCTLVCLSVGADGELTLGFGAVRVLAGESPSDAVRGLQFFLAGGVADSAGLLLALIWTAGFLPGFLEPSAAAVLLTKPVPRWCLILGKYLGVLAFLTVQALAFVAGTYLALGVSTGAWDPCYLLAFPVLVLHFAIFFSFSSFLAVFTRSPVVCVFGSLLFWLVCWGVNLGRLQLVAIPQQEEMTTSLQGASEVGYWVLPKPADLGLLLAQAMHAESFLGPADLLRAAQSQGAFHPLLSVLSSLTFAACLLILTIYEFNTREY